MLIADRRALLRRASCALVVGFWLPATRPKARLPRPWATLPQRLVADAMALAATAHGFSVGPAMAAHTVYVFFDATCPHCARLWADSQVLHDRLTMVWIPPGVRISGVPLEPNGL